MDSNSNHSNNGDDVFLRRSTTPTSSTNLHHQNQISTVVAAGNASASARQSPKIMNVTTSPMIASPSVSNVPVASTSLCVTSLIRNTSSPGTTVQRKVMSKNYNNTLFPTSFPTNLAELQLFRVMQNASLLYYYDTLLEMGGDDVQQLCDAGEEEFLEIMSLVGMASKPLHVRRFQKSLQEWVTNPSKFKTPLSPGEDFELERTHYSFEDTARSLYASSPASPNTQSAPNKRPYSPLDTAGSCPPSSSSSPGSSTSLSLSMINNSTPTLLDSQINKLAAAAERLSKHLPQFEPKPQNNKKKMCKELELVMSMPDTDPRRMDEIRRYAAIYGRFDCKRRPEKPLTLHEVSVNEAAAQICRFIPALLTRRDELFPLARQVVKDSGCHYSKTGVGYSAMDTLSNSNSSTATSLLRSTRLSGLDDGPANKRQRYEDSIDDETLASLGMGQKRLGHQEFSKHYETSSRSSIHLSASLLHANSKSHTARICSLSTEDETDLHYSLSDSNSPLQDNDKIENTLSDDHEPDKLDQIETTDSKYSPRVQVIAASGDNIIAVANPALALSPLEHLTE